MGDVEEREFGYLPLTIAIETLGGISTPLVLRGTPLPATRTQVFSTASDNQPSVEIHILMGESPIAKNNVSLSRFTLANLPQAPRGVPQIQVTFQVNKKCQITASALEKTSGKRVEVNTENAHPLLSNEKIEELIKRAEETRSDDDVKIGTIETRNRANNAVHRAEILLERFQSSGNLGEHNKSIEKALAEVGLALNSTNLQGLKTKVEVLEKLTAQASTGQEYGNLGDIFDSFFGKVSYPKTKTTTSKDTPPVASSFRNPYPKANSAASQHVPPKSRIPTDKLNTRSTQTSNIGRIFGGGEFTLDPNLCFILMPFDDELQAIYHDHIRLVVESKGLSCLRADEVVGTGPITRDIWEKTNRARVIIADLTGKNPNVFYELGIAHALGKEVILITQKIDNVPFDLKALRCIVYSFTPRGMKEMESKLAITIDEVMRLS